MLIHFLVSKNQSNKYVAIEDSVKLEERKHSFGKLFVYIF